MRNEIGVAVLALASVTMLPGVVMGQSGYVMAAGPGARGTQGYLGVDIRDVSEEQMGALKLKETRGAEILRVDHDGPAGKAGLREHDVILQMNGQVVEGQEQLRRMLRETPAGRQVTLVISRDGQQQTMQATMANREEVERQAWAKHMGVPEAPRDEMGAGAVPPPAGPGGSVGGTRGGLGFFHGAGPGLPKGERGFLGTMMGAPYTGAMLEPLGPQLGEFFGVQSGAGLLVRSVEANSPAATAGMKAGDVVIKANQSTMASVSDWMKTLHENKGRPVPLLVIRDKKEQTLTLTPDAKRRSEMTWPDFGPGFAEVTPDGDVLVADGGPMMDGRMALMMDEARRQTEALTNSPEMRRRMDELTQRLHEMEKEREDLLQ